MLLLILFILYASKLLEICDYLKARVSAIRFIDNTNILIYGTFIEANYRTLKGVYA